MQQRIAYLVWNEDWSPILRGQAGDVVKLLCELEPQVCSSLAVGVSLRRFLNTRRKIKSFSDEATVMPVFPGNRNWLKNLGLISWYLRLMRPSAMICRGPVATALALRARERTKIGVSICYDGRAARSAEVQEYSPHDPLADEIYEIEREAIHGADWRIAVSHALVDHWKGVFSYEGDRHTVIPCSLASQFSGVDAGARVTVRDDLGWSVGDTVIAHAGGGAGWQHGRLTLDALRFWLRKDNHLRLLCLSKPNPDFDALLEGFPGQVVIKQVEHEAMPRYLSACDYGLLIREDNTTNRVASPVKFAEYLSCGLKVLCSDSIGDFSQLVKDNNLGAVVTGQNYFDLDLCPIDEAESVRISDEGLRLFSKGHAHIRGLYRAVVTEVTGGWQFRAGGPS